MTLDLEDLQRKASAATPGPWEWEAPMYPGQECYVRGPGRCIAEVDCGDIEQIADDNAAYIAAANPKTILALIAEVRQLREALEWYADKQNYIDGPSVSENVYAPYYPILEDRGSKAQTAIGGSDEGN